MADDTARRKADFERRRQRATGAKNDQNPTLNKSKARLNQMDITADLERTNSELELKMRQQDEFIAALTHDLKSPLLSTTRILEMLISSQLTAEQQVEALNRLLGSHREMLRMILNMLDVHRQDGGGIVPLFGRVKIYPLLTECVDAFSFNINEKELSVSIHVEDDVECILTDELLLRRIITNLVSNAIKFSERCGRVTVRGFKREQSYKISVWNNGLAMTEKQKQSIFQHFLQSSRDCESHHGTGIGLYLSRGLAVTLSGDLTFTSEVESGTEFVLTLPQKC